MTRSSVIYEDATAAVATRFRTEAADYQAIVQLVSLTQGYPAFFLTTLRYPLKSPNSYMKDESLSTHRIRPLIRHFLPLVDLLAELFGPNCEVVLHDFSLPRGTIVKIRNGHLSGRRVGGPITDFGLQMIRKLREDPQAAILQLNYLSRGYDGRELKSASMIIRDKGRNVGALCINLDLAPLEDAPAIPRRFLQDARNEWRDRQRRRNLCA